MIWNWIALAVLLVPAAAPFSILRYEAHCVCR